MNTVVDPGELIPIYENNFERHFGDILKVERLNGKAIVYHFPDREGHWTRRGGENEYIEYFPHLRELRDKSIATGFELDI